MSWQNSQFITDYGPNSTTGLVESFKLNEKCFIRKQHKCGKVFGASKSCFIACPTQDELEPILELMSEKLAKAGIEPIIAVKERAYGQDIFCTKICGKIIESRCCIVILDDAIVDGKNIPNPNVYYEYGLMTALRKHIIPLQKEDLKLAFNIQSYDTIKYTSKNIGTELDRAIKDAIKLTDAQEKQDEHPLFTDKNILRRFELAGFTKTTIKWFLSGVINDTNFIGFGLPEKGNYLYLGRVDDESDLQTYMDDLGVVLYRTEKKIRDMIENKEEYKKRIVAIQAEAEPQTLSSARARVPQAYSARSIKEFQEQISEIDQRLSRMSKIFIGFILVSDMSTKEVKDRAEAIVGNNERYEVAIGTRDEITVGGIKIIFSDSAH